MSDIDWTTARCWLCHRGTDSTRLLAIEDGDFLCTPGNMECCTSIEATGYCVHTLDPDHPSVAPIPPVPPNEPVTHGGAPSWWSLLWIGLRGVKR